MNKKVILMILDGWGKSPDPKVSAEAAAEAVRMSTLANEAARTARSKS
jgi:2,3-bisphosphoglycerate-independent phosphoglycerate mutase